MQKTLSEGRIPEDISSDTATVVGMKDLYEAVDRGFNGLRREMCNALNRHGADSQCVRCGGASDAA